MNVPIQIVDLFAGPGGLGEGFSAFSASGEPYSGNRPFRICISAEKDPVAHQTLRLRAFYRQFASREEVPAAYYDYLAGEIKKEDFESLPEFEEQWRRASDETRCLTLGQDDDNTALDRYLTRNLRADTPWVLIGGPPCQAYSLVGRARNRGIAGYTPEEDSRHYLYQEYLRIIRKFRPAVFVMENVKGILSSRVSGELIFHKILSDLRNPPGSDKGTSKSSLRYRLYSLRTGGHVGDADNDRGLDAKEFIVEAETYGVPQRRHRVFVLGVREDIDVPAPPGLTPHIEDAPTVHQVINDLPPLRSGLSGKGMLNDFSDGYDAWLDVVAEGQSRLVRELEQIGAESPSNEPYCRVGATISEAIHQLRARNDPLHRRSTQSDRPPYASEFDDVVPAHLLNWYRNRRLRTIPNHETRAHIPADLHRYLFAAAWGQTTSRSPKAGDFPVGLAPEHLNWTSGKFADRFRVQLAGEPATTITSHISKDGHYYIHYTPKQCRSLTVREAARIQTFPDDYYFEGPRTEQYVQVGNAVPPYLARQIADVVWKILQRVSSAD